MRLATTLIAATALLSANGTLGADYRPRQNNLSAKVCFERFENNGVLNIRPANIVLDEATRVTLLGGQAVCIFIEPGQHTAYVHSTDPYDPHSADDNAWRSGDTSFHARPKDTLPFRVCAVHASASDKRNWELVPIGRGCD